MDETALANALKIGHLAAAGLDVFETEPLQARSAFLNLKILYFPHTLKCHLNEKKNG